uniref:Uncharacterized protein n=1 Tax=Pyramimonas orientalis virus TaxID=455367 RepID=A0A7M3UP64_POV01|nr:hypothetical protein HWQ62_00398 [Pyramimonas orientalis virus]
MASSKMTFVDGVTKTTISEQMIAFYIHTIDVYASMAERGHSKLPTSAMGDHFGENFDNLILDAETFKATGTNTSSAFLGAAREGLKHLLETLPKDVKEPVMAYATKRLKNIEELPFDVILGCEDPYEKDQHDNVVLKCFSF